MTITTDFEHIRKHLNIRFPASAELTQTIQSMKVRGPGFYSQRR